MTMESLRDRCDDFRNSVGKMIVVFGLYLMPLVIFAQLGGYGLDPSNMMYIPTIMDGVSIYSMNTNQFPVGWSGIRPVGRTKEGLPVYNRVPVYKEVDGAFVALVQFPGVDPRFPGMPRWKTFPAKGKARKKFILKLKKEIDEAFRQQQYAQAYRNVSGEALMESQAEEAERNRIWAKQQRLRDREHQRQLDLMDKRFYHMNDNQLRHYREGWKPVVQPVGGMQYGTPDLMVDPSGYLYWVP